MIINPLLDFSSHTTGSKPFSCPHCDKTFRTSGHRKTHIESHFRDDATRVRPPRRVNRHSRFQSVPLPDIPLQEPIMITDAGEWMGRARLRYMKLVSF